VGLPNSLPFTSKGLGLLRNYGVCQLLLTAGAPPTGRTTKPLFASVVLLQPVPRWQKPKKMCKTTALMQLSFRVVSGTYERAKTRCGSIVVGVAKTI